MLTDGAEPVVRAEPAGDEVLSRAELSAAIEKFSGLDWLRLKKAAVRFCGTGADWEDLQNEALVRALDGRRKCPKNLRVVTFLGNVIRSIASEHDGLDGRSPPSDELEAQQETGAGAVALTEPADLLASRLEEAVALFDDDEIAQKLFEAMVDGIEGQELRNLLELSQKDFDSKRRLVRRRLNQHFERNVS
jgi:DNA-directed RNA polymerase specialized sigma24 family protein